MWLLPEPQLMARQEADPNPKATHTHAHCEWLRYWISTTVPGWRGIKATAMGTIIAHDKDLGGRWRGSSALSQLSPAAGAWTGTGHPLAFDAKIVLWQVGTRSLTTAKLPRRVFWWFWLFCGLGDHLMPIHHKHMPILTTKSYGLDLCLNSHHLKLYPPYLQSLLVPTSLLQSIPIISFSAQNPFLAHILGLLWSGLSLASNIHHPGTP